MTQRSLTKTKKNLQRLISLKNVFHKMDAMQSKDHKDLSFKKRELLTGGVDGQKQN